jgi:hypothetical protein
MRDVQPALARASLESSVAEQRSEDDLDLHGIRDDTPQNTLRMLSHTSYIGQRLPARRRCCLASCLDMPGRFSLYDDRAKRVLALAQDEAWRFRQPAIAPEHLLLAVIRAGTGDRPGSGSVGEALNALGLTLGRARQELESLGGRGDAEPQRDEERVIAFTPEGDKVIDLAPTEAQALKAEKVSDRHVLLAVLREPGKAEGMLQSFGLSTEAVRQRVIGSK